MKKILLTIILFLFELSLSVSAAGTPSPTGGSTNSIPNPLPSNLSDVPGILKWLTGILFPLVALGLLTMLIYGGFTKLTAAGDVEKEKKSMQIITATITGFVIIALSGVIVNTVCAVIGVQCF